jgi:hypothetical protein
VRREMLLKLTAATIVFSMSPASQAGMQAKNVMRYVGQMTQAKTLAESYVGIAKDHMDPKSAAYTTAQKKYADAYSKYSAWLAVLEVGIRQGATRKLDEDADFQRQGQNAANAATDFVNYVDQATQQSKAVITVFTDITTAALKIWQGVKDQQTKDRQNLITDLNNDAKWKSWTDLTAAPTKPEPKPSKPSV